MNLYVTHMKYALPFEILKSESILLHQCGPGGPVTEYGKSGSCLTGRTHEQILEESLS